MDELWKKFSLTKLARTGSPEKEMTRNNRLQIDECI
jgi:hypothetical protein